MIKELIIWVTQLQRNSKRISDTINKVAKEDKNNDREQFLDIMEIRQDIHDHDQRITENKIDIENIVNQDSNESGETTLRRLPVWGTDTSMLPYMYEF